MLSAQFGDHKPTSPTGSSPRTAVETRDPAALLVEHSHDPRLVWTGHIGATQGRLATSPPAQMSANLLDLVAPNGLWKHQAAAIESITRQHHTLIATGTGSGKSACYQLPIAARLHSGPLPTALVIQPTKALAHDQLKSFARLFPNFLAMAHDGDADNTQRHLARREARVIFTNPEMCHGSILARHTRWSRFLGHLEFVVIDELHAFRGVFGSHVAHIIRRLRRVCAFHGAKPTFVLTSATVSGAQQLAEALIGSEVVVVDDDAAPSAHRTIAVWDPTAGTRDRRISVLQDAADLTAQLVDRGHRVIGFSRARSTTEAIAELTRGQVEDPSRIVAYRGGYLAGERRTLETMVANGEVDAVIATSALELGIDIGQLDAAILAGFPGTISSFRQQIGRVGRRGQNSLAILVAGEDQLDRWLVNHPNELLERSGERIVINPDNPSVVRPQLACAAHEIPLDPVADHRWWPTTLDAAVCDLAAVGLLKPRNGLAMFTQTSHPGRQVGLRAAGSDTVRIETTDSSLIGTIDSASAPASLHTGARYVHQGIAYRVQELDLDTRRATVALDDRGICRSRSHSTTTINILDRSQQKRLGDGEVSFGTVRVKTVVDSYVVTTNEGRIIERGELDYPPHVVTTSSIWMVANEPQLEHCLGDKTRIAGALHATEHAIIGALPMFAICDRWDVAGTATPCHAQTLGPVIFVYDSVSGGGGISQLAFRAAPSIVTAATDLVGQCTCSDGCPACVVSPNCGRGNSPLDKHGALDVLALFGA